ncbi:MAG TPA: Ig-like domain repeat protein [Actinomycetota bacterium]|nr:Ig-like domain repeat protein [Actinomycetota bacterium]
MSTQASLWLKRVAAASLAAALVLPLAPTPAVADPGAVTDLPVLSRETPAGGGTVASVDGPAPTSKTIDGHIDDWTGEPTRYGGTAVYSAGELVYQDHLFDALGPDDGRDADRLATTDPIEQAAPETYRIDALAQADAPGEFGAPTPEQFSWDDTYGDAVDHQDAADIEELRLALDGDRLDVLLRTTTMRTPSDTALLLLADTQPGSNVYDVPFNSGLRTSVADVAVFVADGTVRFADLATGDVTDLGGASAAADASGWTNALEAALPAAALTDPNGTLRMAAATGAREVTGFAHLQIETNDDQPHPNVANVAFRFDEPVRTWFDKQQALALHDGTIDPFFYDVDVAAMNAGASQRFTPTAGYHDRIFLSDPSTGVPKESGRDGIFQHYGIYLPSAYDGSTPLPLQWWLHWRGGNAHSGAAIVPKVFKQMGEDVNTIVVAPSGRGTSTWYVGRGHVDILEVWRDVFASYAVDRDRVYVSGHSMGGWGTYLLTLLYPDRFAGGAPVAGPVTMGAWTGADFPGCDSFKYDDYTPCYIDANGSRPRDQHTRKLLENALHVPYAILQGTSDELVPYSGVFRQSERLAQLGYRYRLYTYPGYEHYSHPAMDQWADVADYLHGFTRDPNPAHVVYRRDMPFELATEQVQSDGVALDFDFDSAYWMSGLEPIDATKGVATFDGRSLAIAETPHVTVPDSGAPTAPGQTGPYVITGLQWLDDPTASTPPETNAFSATLTGASAVTLDLSRMSIDDSAPVAGTISTSDALDLGLAGSWTSTPEVTVDGAPANARLSDGVLHLDVPAGTHSIVVTPANEPETAATTVTFTDSSATSGQYSDAATLSARLTTDSGPVAGETLTFTLGSQTVTAETGQDGVATANIDLTDVPGSYDATAGYGGSDGLAPSTTGTPFSIRKEDSSLSLSLAGKGSKRSATAIVTDRDGSSSIAGRPVTFFVDGREFASATTDPSGAATVDVPARFAGHHEFRAVFGGDPYYTDSSASRSS